MVDPPMGRVTFVRFRLTSEQTEFTKHTDDYSVSERSEPSERSAVPFILNVLVYATDKRSGLCACIAGVQDARALYRRNDVPSGGTTFVSVSNRELITNDSNKRRAWDSFVMQTCTWNSSNALVRRVRSLVELQGGFITDGRASTESDIMLYIERLIFTENIY